MVEVKRRGSSTLSAMPQLAAYMGIVHAARKEDRKQNAIVYGIASNGTEFQFCRLDHDGVFSRMKSLEWLFEADRIFSIMRAVIRAAALSSPSTTPIRNPLRREIVLKRYGSPRYSRQFDYGHSTPYQAYYKDGLEDDDNAELQEDDDDNDDDDDDEYVVS